MVAYTVTAALWYFSGPQTTTAAPNMEFLQGSGQTMVERILTCA